MNRRQRNLAGVYTILVTCCGVGSNSPAFANEKQGIYPMEVAQSLHHRFATTEVVINIYNPEVDFPCISVELDHQDGGKAIEEKDLCVFPDRYGRLFDVRTDVSYLGYEAVSLDENVLSFSAEVSLRESDSFILNCNLPVVPFKIGSLECHLQEAE